MIIPPIDVITLYIQTSDQSRECGKEFIPDLYGERGPRSMEFKEINLQLKASRYISIKMDQNFTTTYSPGIAGS
jgi:hypothetical protein